jgi:hypothetical protein
MANFGNAALMPLMPLMPSRVQRVLGRLMCEGLSANCDIPARIAAGAGVAMTRSGRV